MSTTSSRKALTAHRRRQRRRGIARLEVRVRKGDVPLVRDVVNALNDPKRAEETRALLREHSTAARTKGLKALLASAPLEGVDLTRERDFGRAIDL